MLSTSFKVSNDRLVVCYGLDNTLFPKVKDKITLVVAIANNSITRVQLKKGYYNLEWVKDTCKSCKLHVLTSGNTLFGQISQSVSFP